MHTRLLPHPLRAALASTAVVLLVVGLAACGSDDDPDASDSTSAPSGDSGGGDGGEPVAGTIVARDFSLTNVTVGPGEEIALANQGSAPHTATADDGAFDIGPVNAAASSEPVAAPDEPGSYAFHCEIHPDMTATLTVEG